MKRRKFTFSPAYANSKKAGLKISRLFTQRQYRRRKLKEVRQFIQKSLQGSSLAKGSAAACLFLALGLPAISQTSCKTFQNADAANPITKLLKGSEEIYGLDFVDIDADGDLDCYAKIYSDQTYIPAIPVLFRNVGTNNLPVYVRDANTGFATTDDGFYTFSDIQFADMDGDGDFDCFIGESYSFGGTTIHYYQNQGTPAQPKFVANEAANPVRFAYAFYGITFTIADIDNDGDLDLSYTTDAGFYGSEIYFNIGTQTQPDFQQHKVSPQSFFTRVYYDFNKDGLPDYVDNEYTTQNQYLNIGPKENPRYKLNPPNAPQFNNGIPYRFADINGDGFAEVFNFNGGYATTAPIAVINAKPEQTGNFSYTLLSSANQSKFYTYQWKLNGVDIPGATSSSYRATRKGKYTLTVTGSCGTGISLPYALKTSEGVENNEAFIANTTAAIHSPVLMQASPNPFTSAVTLRIAQTPNGSLIKVCDLQGRVLLTKQTSGATITIGEKLSRGIYVVQVWQKDGLVFSKKIIKE